MSKLSYPIAVDEEAWLDQVATVAFQPRHGVSSDLYRALLPRAHDIACATLVLLHPIRLVYKELGAARVFEAHLLAERVDQRVLLVVSIICPRALITARAGVDILLREESGSTQLAMIVCVSLLGFLVDSRLLILKLVLQL